MKMIFLGAPGAGKGTQADIISERYSIPAISTGAIIREAIKNGTEMGKKAVEYTSTGALVPDEVVIGIIAERLAADDCRNGYILDGFPRTVPQAEALDKMGITLDKVISIEVPDEAIVTRMSGRRVCPDCGMTYHVKGNPSKDNVHCDKCGAVLTTRKDDEAETVKKRLAVYHEQTEPLKDFYKKKGMCAEVNGMDDIAAITSKIVAILDA